MLARVKLTVKELFWFLFYHMYMRPAGIVYAVVGVFTLFAGVYYLAYGNKTGIFFLLIALIYIIFQPIMLYVNALKQSKMIVFQNVTTYEFTEEGIVISQDEVEPITVPWKGILKAAKFKGLYIFYMDAAHANIVTLSGLAVDPSVFEDFLRSKIDKKKIHGFRK